MINLQTIKKHEQKQQFGLTIALIGFCLVVIGSIGPGSVYPIFFLLSSLIFLSTGSLIYFSYKYLTKPAGIFNNDTFISKVTSKGYIAYIISLIIMLFYIGTYWQPSALKNLTAMITPISYLLRAKPSDQYFTYGAIYTFCICLMGIKMLIKYRNNRYQLMRTCFIIFFQLIFAFLIPSLLAFFNQPEKYISYFWPLSYKDLFPANVFGLLNGSSITAKFLLAWTIILSFIITPLLTYLVGKRWYCSWVCGCGGLANTFGDQWRHLSDKSVKAWKFERYSIYSVLVFIIVVTVLLWLNIIFNGSILGSLSHTLSKIYGLLIGIIFAGIIGTGFYPIMGTRVWCRFFCPQAAIFGIIQRFFSRFRITTNGMQCISCGNCSTYCEMGIDVRWYAQRGQNIVRAACVGCGICSAVCPRGVLKLENGPSKNRVLECNDITSDYKSI